MTDEWGPWIEHDGKGCPVLPGVRVQVMTLDGDMDEAMSDEFEWEFEQLGTFFTGYIIRYRIRKPRGMTVLQEIVASPERELETA